MIGGIRTQDTYLPTETLHYYACDDSSILVRLEVYPEMSKYWTEALT